MGKVTEKDAKRIQIAEDKKGTTNGFKARAQREAAKNSK